jgi:hypothetical protein
MGNLPDYSLTMNREIIELEIRKGRHCLIMQKVIPGPLLKAAVAAPVSFFYRITLDGSLRTFTHNALEAQAVWRDDLRWLGLGQLSAEVLA